MIAYVTFVIVGFGMEHWKEGLHAEQMLELWAASCNLVEVGPVFTCDIHAIKGRHEVGQLSLYVQGICKDLSPEHIEGT